MERIFGTDGIRGIANADLTPELALHLARAAAQVLPALPTAAQPMNDPAALRRHLRPVAIVGRDPRASGEMLQAAVVAGIASAGVDVYDLGVLPTPAVAYLTAELGVDLGIVISASHNAMPDNGIKFFAAGGQKLSDTAEDAIQAALDAPGILPTGADIGRIARFPEAVRRYCDHLLLATPQPLDGLHIVVDCAHGAASDIAPDVYRRAGAQVTVIGAEPDGWNINDGVGSTHLAGLCQAVQQYGAEVGIAHDGDADRCLAVAHDGTIIDGDVILGLLALAMQRRGELADNTVVSTVMANLGFHRRMEQAGIAVRTTAVGDRYVLAEMARGSYSLGGEQSGHIVISDLATTGDGLLTALQLMSLMVERGEPLADLAAQFPKFPQLLINIACTNKYQVMEHPDVAHGLLAAENELTGRGRVLLRASGTENLVRVMVETEDEELTNRIAGQLADTVRAVATAII